LIITVDGPAAAGKSTAARRLASRLGFRYLDTGAMYRAATWKALQAGADLETPGELAALVRSTRIELEPDGRVLCDGEDVTEEIRNPRVTRNIYHLADEPDVRAAMRKHQRQFAREGDLVSEGRDQGTEVFPDADLKFYLSASLKERARRRWKELREAGRRKSLEQVRQELAERDARDSRRPVGALRKTDDMILIDNTDMTPEEAVRAMVEHVRGHTAA
jgi:cytidylate kinase